MNQFHENRPQLHLLCEDLAMRRGEALLFAGLSFRLEAGHALVLTGRNGSGKSTLLRVLAGLMTQEHGRASLVETASGALLPMRESSHYFGHRNAMRPELTVAENLRFWQRFLRQAGPLDASQSAESPSGESTSRESTGGESQDRALHEAGAAVGLEDLLHLPFGYLSAGQQRRLAFAKLLLSQRPLWLLDEPTAALDQGSDRLFAALIDRHLHLGGLVVTATHQPLGLSAPIKEMQMTGFLSQETSPWL